MTYPSSSDPQDYPRMTPAVQALIAINVAMLFLQWTVGGMLPVLRPGLLAYSGEPLRSWWTPITYMFVHAGVWHLALNMYMLWVFGPRVEHVWGTKRFVWFYLWCGLGGVLAHALFGAGGALVGASGAIYGVMLAFAWQWPREEILIFGVLPMRVSVFVALLAGISLLQGALAPTGTAGSGVAHLAHLGGFAFAFLYLHAPGPGSIDRLRQHVSSVPDGAESPRAIPPRAARSRTRVDEVDEIVAKSKAIVGKQKQLKHQPVRGTLPRLPSDAKPTEVDRLLDKISAEGMDSLTDEERETLSEFSRRLRGR